MVRRRGHAGRQLPYRPRPRLGRRAAPDKADAANEIPGDRAARAGLCYLALGDWHGALKIAPRTWYAGSPEPDRHKANDAGSVHLVELDGLGAPERVETVLVRRFCWARLEVELLDGTCEKALRALEALPREHRCCVVSLRLAGSIGLAERRRLDGELKGGRRASTTWRWTTPAWWTSRRRTTSTPSALPASCAQRWSGCGPRRRTAPIPNATPPAWRCACSTSTTSAPPISTEGADAVRLRRIEVRAFRKIGHLVMEGLADGLNVVVGDNEAGKSTLLAALRAALFEKHRVRGETADAMLPYSQSVRPEVALDFELGGKPWRLRKAFCQRPEAELTGPGERFTGDAVEERLAELFGFTPPGKGRSKPEEHQGVYGLLWVEQGASHRALGIGGGRETIASALEAEVGEAVGGERGRALLAAAEERRDAFWGKNNKPRGAYKALLEELEGLAKRNAELEAQLGSHDAKVTELGTKQEALARHAREDRLSEAVRDVAAAKEAHVQTQRLQDALKEADERLRRERTMRDAAAERHRTREGLHGKVDEARASLARTEEAAEEARAILASEEGRARSAEDRLERGPHGFAASRGARGGHRAGDRAASGDRAAVQAGGTALGRGSSGSEAPGGVAAAAALPVVEKDIADLETLQTTLDRAQARLEAAEVRITFLPESERSVSVDGAPHNTGMPLRLSRDAELRLEGYGRLVVRPGGDVGEPARRAEDAARALARDLARHGFRSVAEAKAALRSKADAMREAKRKARSSRRSRPKAWTACARRSGGSARSLSGRRRTRRPPPSTPPYPHWRRRIARGTRPSKRSRRTRPRPRPPAAPTPRPTETRPRRASAPRPPSGSMTRPCANSPPPARRRPTSNSRKRWTPPRRPSNSRSRPRRKRGPRWSGPTPSSPPSASRGPKPPSGPSAPTSRSSPASGATSRSSSGPSAGTGSASNWPRWRGASPSSAGRRPTRDLEAAAARLLCGPLAEAQREAKDRWLAPVRAAASNPTSGLIRPESDIVLNEDSFEIEDLVREGVKEPFQSLSVGAREQVAVITRLALADALRVSGRPAAVILDDALVNADEGRLEGMHLVLHKAARGAADPRPDVPRAGLRAAGRAHAPIA